MNKYKRMQKKKKKSKINNNNSYQFNSKEDHIYLKPNIFELAKENNKSALYQIGDAYLKLRTKIGYLKALDWYQKSAGAGSAVAQNRIGEMFHHGLGVIKDYHQALEWYFLATETGGSSAAHNNLGTMYYDGKGVGIDHVKALTCFSVAANQGYRDAQFNLAWMYDNENSPVHDKVEAMKWYLKAAEQGHDGAKRRVVQLHRMGIRYRPEYDTNQRPKASPSASKSTTSVRTNTANGTKGANKGNCQLAIYFNYLISLFFFSVLSMISNPYPSQNCNSDN
jgi:TPR repeat protein